MHSANEAALAPILVATPQRVLNSEFNEVMFRRRQRNTDVCRERAGSGSRGSIAGRKGSRIWDELWLGVRSGMIMIYAGTAAGGDKVRCPRIAVVLYSHDRIMVLGIGSIRNA